MPQEMAVCSIILCIYLAVVASTLLFVVLLFPARVRLRDFIDRRLRQSRAQRLARQHRA